MLRTKGALNKNLTLISLKEKLSLYKEKIKNLKDINLSLIKENTTLRES